MYRRTLYTTIMLIIKCLSAANLGPNLLVNHDFSMPDLIAQNTFYQIFDSPILGWNCSGYCQINNCFQFNKFALQYHQWDGFSGDCPSQSLDTDSYFQDIISQIFLTQAGQHFLAIKFLLPLTYWNYKKIVLMMNDEIIYEYRSPIRGFNHIQASMKINLKEGFNNVSFKTEGFDDGVGFRIFDVKIQRIIEQQIESLIAMTTNSNTLLSNMISIPCSRIIFGELINTAISFDRLQLYYYHHRRNSYYYGLFIEGVARILNQKGIYATFLSDMFFQSIGTSQQSILKAINFKKGRKYKDGYYKNNFMQNDGFFFMVSSLPITLIIFFIFHIMFHITFKYKISKVFRKYSFFCLILLMLFEGNIQQFTFFILDEFLEYFSITFIHKAANFTIALIFYIIFFCSTVFYLYCWKGLKKNMSYLTQNISINMSGIAAYTFDRGFTCLVLGATHRLTLLYGNNQLLILAAVQLILITIKAAFLLSTAYKCKKMGWMSIIEGFIRICFQFSIFVYENSGDESGFINEEIHIRIIYLFLIIWALNLAFSFIEVMINSFSQRQQMRLIKTLKNNSSNEKRKPKGTLKKRQKLFNQQINILEIKFQSNGEKLLLVKHGNSFRRPN